jgi:hypothetical protein
MGNPKETALKVLTATDTIKGRVTWNVWENPKRLVVPNAAPA